MSTTEPHERRRRVIGSSGPLQQKKRASALTEDTLYELLERVSRTFALSNRMLPPRFREPMTVAYLLFRVSDYLEDNSVLEQNHKARLLATWNSTLAGTCTYQEMDAALQPLPRDGSEAEVTHRYREILAALDRLPPRVAEVIRTHAGETTRGMQQFQQRAPQIRTEADLDEYMYYVAGVVGVMITEIFSAVSPRVRSRRHHLLPLAREYGLGLQSVNILRGLKKDFERGWIYVPDSFCADENIAPHQLVDPDHRVAALRVIDRVANKAERHLENGLRYVQLLPRTQHRLRIAAVWPLMFAAGTLSVTRDNPDTLYAEAKISRDEVRDIVRRTTRMGWSNRWLARYFRRLLHA